MRADPTDGPDEVQYRPVMDLVYTAPRLQFPHGICVDFYSVEGPRGAQERIARRLRPTFEPNSMSESTPDISDQLSKHSHVARDKRITDVARVY